MVALIALGAYLAKRARLIGRRWAKAMLLTKWKATGQKSPILWPALWVAAAMTRQSMPAIEKPEPMMSLVDFVGFAPALPIPTIKERDEREEADADNGVERDEPGGGQLFAKEDEVELLVAPDKVGVEDLVVRHDRDGEHRDEQDERNDRAPVASGEFRAARLRGRRSQRGLRFPRRADISGRRGRCRWRGACRRRRRRSRNASRNFAERANDERRGDDAGIDAEVENLEGVGAPEVVGLVERADLAGDVALEHAATEDQTKEREEKCALERHEEMAGRHGERAEQNRAAPAEQAVGEEAAQDRREINAGGVSAEDGGGEGLPVESAIKREPAEGFERDDVLDAPGQQEILDHVKDEQRLHAVERKAFPSLGEGEIPKSARMTEEIGHVIFAGERRGILGFGDGGHVGRRLTGILLPCKCCCVSGFRIAAALRIVSNSTCDPIGPAT